MALKNTLQITRSGFAGALRKTDCYVLVTGVEGRDSLRITYAYYDLDTNERMAVRSTTFTPDTEGEGYIKQSYDFLKTLDEFDDAEDYTLPGE